MISSAASIFLSFPSTLEPIARMNNFLLLLRNDEDADANRKIGIGLANHTKDL